MLCLAGAAWCIGAALWRQAPITTHPVWWLPLILLGWHVDQRLFDYYRLRVGCVTARRRIERLVRLITIAIIYIGLRLLESQTTTVVALSALFVAGVQLHIGLISGQGFRRHYLVGTASWVALAALPLLHWSTGERDVAWLLALRVTLAFLGWRDHRLLMRSLGSSGVHDGDV